MKEGGGYQYVSDILRARLVADSIDELKTQLAIFECIPGVKVIKYKPKFHGVNQSELRHVSINFVWSNSFVCELQIRLGEAPVLEQENHFLY